LFAHSYYIECFSNSDTIGDDSGGGGDKEKEVGEQEQVISAGSQVTLKMLFQPSFFLCLILQMLSFYL
jgi:hypothetical protein